MTIMMMRMGKKRIMLVLTMKKRMNGMIHFLIDINKKWNKDVTPAINEGDPKITLVVIKGPKGVACFDDGGSTLDVPLPGTLMLKVGQHRMLRFTTTPT